MASPFHTRRPMAGRLTAHAAVWLVMATWVAGASGVQLPPLLAVPQCLPGLEKTVGKVHVRMQHAILEPTTEYPVFVAAMMGEERDGLYHYGALLRQRFGPGRSVQLDLRHDVALSAGGGLTWSRTVGPERIAKIRACLKEGGTPCLVIITGGAAIPHADLAKFNLLMRLGDTIRPVFPLPLQPGAVDGGWNTPVRNVVVYVLWESQAAWGEGKSGQELIPARDALHTTLQRLTQAWARDRSGGGGNGGKDGTASSGQRMLTVEALMGRLTVVEWLAGVPAASREAWRDMAGRNVQCDGVTDLSAGAADARTRRGPDTESGVLPHGEHGYGDVDGGLLSASTMVSWGAGIAVALITGILVAHQLGGRHQTTVNAPPPTHTRTVVAAPATPTPSTAAKHAAVRASGATTVASSVKEAVSVTGAGAGRKGTSPSAAPRRVSPSPQSRRAAHDKDGDSTASGGAELEGDGEVTADAAGGKGVDVTLRRRRASLSGGAAGANLGASARKPVSVRGKE